MTLQFEDEARRIGYERKASQLITRNSTVGPGHFRPGPTFFSRRGIHRSIGRVKGPGGDYVGTEEALRKHFILINSILDLFSFCLCHWVGNGRKIY